MEDTTELGWSIRRPTTSSSTFVDMVVPDGDLVPVEGGEGRVERPDRCRIVVQNRHNAMARRSFGVSATGPGAAAGGPR